MLARAISDSVANQWQEPHGASWDSSAIDGIMSVGFHARD